MDVEELAMIAWNIPCLWGFVSAVQTDQISYPTDPHSGPWIGASTSPEVCEGTVLLERKLQGLCESWQKWKKGVFVVDDDDVTVCFGCLFVCLLCFKLICDFLLWEGSYGGEGSIWRGE